MMELTNAMKPAPSQPSPTNGIPPVSKKAKNPGEAEFDSALALAGGAAQQTLATPQVVVNATAKGSEANLSAEGTSAKKTDLGTHGVEQKEAPLNQKTAASTKTAAVIAGPKPWSKDWVFDGIESNNPELKPLFGNETQSEKPLPKTESKPQDLNSTAVNVAALNLLERSLVNSGGETGATPSISKTGPSASAQGMNASGISPDMLNARIAPLSQLSPLNQMMGNSVSNTVQAMKGTGQKMKSEMSTAAEQMALPEDLEVISGATAQGPSLRESAGPISGLSGLEFVDTLGKVRSDQSNSGQMMDMSGNSAGGQPGGALLRKDLKVIDGGKKTQAGQSNLMGVQSGNSPSSTKFKNSVGSGNEQAAATDPSVSGNMMVKPHTGPNQVVIPSAVVTGHVTTGTMTKERLTHESLGGMSTEIRNLGSQGGGEMRVRLKPENLGELHIRVMTNGTDVGLQIQASDESAKKIIEESMSFLKESLAGQNLTLGKVDVIVATASAGGSADQNRGDSQQSQSQNFSGLMGQQNQSRSDQGPGQNWNQGEPGLQSRPTSTVAGASSMARASGGRAPSSMNQAGRLDVMA